MTLPTASEAGPAPAWPQWPQWRQLVDDAAVPMAVVASSGAVLHGNAAWVRVCGGGADGPAEVTAPANVTALWPAQEQGEAVLLVRDTFRTGQPWQRQVAQQLSGLPAGWLQLSGSALRDDAGRVIALLVVAQDVSAEQQEIARYRTLFNRLDAGFCLIEMIFDEAGRPVDYRFTEVNAAFAAQTGLADAVGRRMRDLAPAHEQHWFDIYGGVARTGHPVRFENHAQALGQRWYDVHAFRVGSPAAPRVAILFNDITARKQVAAQLAASEARFRQLAQAMPSSVWTADASGALTWMNQRGRDDAGECAQGLADPHWPAMLHPDDHAAAQRRWAQAVQTGRPFDAELRLRVADGGYRWHLVRALPLRDGGTDTPQWLGVNTDIHDQRALREQLARLNARLETEVVLRTQERDHIWQISPDLLACGQLDGTLEAINPAWTTVLGHDERDVLRQGLWPLMPDDSAAVARDALQQLQSGQVVRVEVQLRTAAGGHRWFEWVAAATGSRYYAVARDTTDARQRQHELASAQAALRHAQKMEAVGQLTGGIAHDFNNLLQVVGGNLQLVERLVRGQPNAERRVQAALEAVRRGAKLAEQLLAFGRRQALEPRPIHLGRFLHRLDDLLCRALGAGMTVRIDAPPDTWCCNVDPLQLENAVLNLAINARDATQGRGQLSLNLCNVVLPRDARSGDTGLPAGDYVRLDVRDNGSGMNAQVLAQVFEPFFSTKPAGAGSGLGLSMVYGFVQQSAGHIHIESSPDQGTLVQLYLPRTGLPEQPPPERPDARWAPGSGTVLLAEDDDSVRATVKALLQDMGYDVIETADAAQALAVLERDTPIDVLLSDVMMPGDLSSTALVAQVQARWPSVAVLLASGFVDPAQLAGADLPPDVPRLAKPFSAEQLAGALQAALARRAGGP